MNKTLTSIALSLCLTTLSGCGIDRPTWLGGEDKRPAASVKVGEKRRPALNPAPGAPAQLRPEMQRPMTPPPPPPGPPSIDTNPYGYYKEQQGNVPLPPPSPPENLYEESSVRKSFAGATAEPPVSGDLTPRVVTVTPPPQVKEVPPAVTVETAEAPLPADPSPGAASGSWFSHISDRLSGSPQSAEEEKLNANPYPKLSDVPPRPEKFKELKIEQAERLQEMQDEHALAQQQRQMLGSEPSQTANGEVLLGHAYDNKLSPASESPQESGMAASSLEEAAPMTPPQPMVKAAYKAPAEPTKYDLLRAQEQTLY